MSVKKIIFSVNPGATTTKCSLYEVHGKTVKEVVSETIEHPTDKIKSFDSIAAQVDYRDDLVKNFIKKNLPKNSEVIACAGRGGMLTPVPSGVILVNEELVEFSLFTPVYQHASNLGAALAFRMSKIYNCPAYISDPVAVDELPEIARISGSPLFPRFSFVHALNVRATVRHLSKRLKKPFNKMRCVVAHLGAGFSIAAFDRGRIVDNDNRMESAPFTPERAGGVPPIPLINACFSGEYTKAELMKKLYGEGGMYAYLGTKDVREVLARIKDGDRKAKLVLDAMIYQICKDIAAMGSVIDFDIDGLIITGGIAQSDYICKQIKKRVGRAMKIFLYPGSSENEALAENALRVLNNEEKYLTWPVKLKTKSIL